MASCLEDEPGDRPADGRALAGVLRRALETEGERPFALQADEGGPPAEPARTGTGPPPAEPDREPDAAAFRRLSSFPRQGPPVTAAALSPCGEYLAAWSSGGAWPLGGPALRIWAVAGPAEVCVLGPGPGGGAVRAARFSPDGARLAAAYDDGHVRVWEVVGRKAILDVAGASPGWARLLGLAGLGCARACDLDLTPDGRVLLSGHEDGTLRWWDSATGAALGCVAGHRGAVLCVRALGSQGAVSAGEDGTARLWDLVTRAEVGRLAGHKAAVTCVAIAPGGAVVATAGRDETVRLWGPESCRQLAALKEHTAEVNGVAFGGESGRLYSAGQDGTVRLWGLPAGRELARYDSPAGQSPGCWCVPGTGTSSSSGPTAASSACG